MSGAHGKWCNTVTFPTKCSHCGKRVFFLRCDHGSAVFFDALGEPWPKHVCEKSWRRTLARWTDSSGTINVKLTPGVTVRRPPEGGIDAAVATRAKRRKQQPDPIKAVEPDGEANTTVVGVLREKHVQVDVVTALKLPEASGMVAAFLGPLGKGRWGKVTVHAPSADEDVLHSYTAWVPADVLSRLVGGTGTAVTVGLYSVSVVGSGCFWVCNTFEVIG